MNKERTAFFIRAYNDVDHFVPLIAEFVKKNENPLIILITNIDIENDYRINYLETLGKFEVYKDVDKDFIKSEKRNTFLSKLNSRLYSIKRNRESFFGKLYRKVYLIVKQSF